MDRLTQEGLTLATTSRDFRGGGQDVLPQGAWIEQFKAVDHDAASGARMTWLLRTIEAEIIPRLMLAHQSPAFAVPSAEALAQRAIGRDEVAAFAALVLAQPADAAFAHVAALRADGLALDAIYLDLLSPTARHLGEMWEADLCDFTQVTLGLWRLQQLLYDLSPAFQDDATFSAQRRRALLAPAPGSQHTLGLFIVAEFFRRAGWDVCGEPTASLADLTAAMRSEWFDVVGLSVGADCQLDDLSSVILSLRRASRNKGVGVMVGGAVFSAQPDLATAVGADMTAADAPQALVLAEAMVALRDKRC